MRLFDSDLKYLLGTAELLIDEMTINAYLSKLILDDRNLFSMVGRENMIDQRGLAYKQSRGVKGVRVRSFLHTAEDFTESKIGSMG